MTCHAPYMSDQDVGARIATQGQVRAMLVNSAVAYVLAQMLVIALHESAHSVAGLVQGYQATQFTGEVRFSPEQRSTPLVITAMAGPLFSLGSGLVAMWFRPFRGRGFASLLWVWLAFLSAEEGFGYFTIAPLVPAGDTGGALAELHAPEWVGWVCLVFGVAGLVFLARRFAVVGVRYTRDVYEIRAFCFHAWIVGTVVSVVTEAAYLALTPDTSPDAVFAILLGAASLGVFAPMAMMFWQKVRTERELLHLGVPRLGIAAAAVVFLVNLLILTRGVHLG